MKNTRFLRLLFPLSFFVVLVLAGRIVSAESVAEPLTVGALCDYATIQEAVDAAASVGDTIMVEAGTISGADALFTVKDKSITIIGGAQECRMSTLNKTTLDGLAAGGRIVNLLDATTIRPVTLQNLVITGGEAPTSLNGGGILATNDYQLQLVNVDVSRNSAQSGGGIYLAGDMNSGTSLGLENSTVTDNSALENGGGIYCSDSSVTINTSDLGSTIGNSAENQGGGIYASRCQVTLEDAVSIKNNSASYGGGIFAMLFSHVSQTGSEVEISNNLAEVDGGGLRIEYQTTVDANNTLIENNRADGNGGGIFATGNSWINLSNARVISNHAVNGAGLRIETASHVSITGQSLISANIATLWGGGIYALGFSYVGIADQSRIMMNEARYGGGIHIVGSSRGEITDSAEIISNSAEEGGGIRLQNGKLSIVGSETMRPRLMGNRSDRKGAAIAGIHSTVIQIRMADILSNTAGIGGGSGIHLQFESTAFITNSRFANNVGDVIHAFASDITVVADYAEAGQSDGCNPMLLPGGTYCSHFDQNHGGAISLNSSSTLTLSNTAITGHTAPLPHSSNVINFYGSNSALIDTVLIANNGVSSALRIIGIDEADQSTVTVRNSTFYSNNGKPIASNEFSGLTLFRNVIWGNSTGTLIDQDGTFFSECNLFQPIFPGSSSFTGSGDISVDPLLSGDGALTIGSPAIDACAGGSPFDIAGRARAIDGNGQADSGEFDMGAFEYSPSVAPTSVEVRGISAEIVTPTRYLVIALILTLTSICIWHRNSIRP